MESDDSQDAAGGDASLSSDSSSGSQRRSQSSSSERSERFSPRPESPPHSARGPSSPCSPDENVSDGRSNINSPENSPSASQDSRSREISSQTHPKTPDTDKNNYYKQYDSQRSPPNGPKTPESPVRSTPASPEVGSGPASPDSMSPLSPRERASGPASPAPALLAEDSGCGPRSPKRSSREWSRHKSDHSQSGSNSSQSSRDSSYNKRSTIKDPATEEISEGEMESDGDSRSQGQSMPVEKPNVKPESHLNISHEDLSDVSDLDSMGCDDDMDKLKRPNSPTQSTNTTETKIINGNNFMVKSPILENGTQPSDFSKQEKDKSHKQEEGEELDFEAEEGECVEAPPPSTNDKLNSRTPKDDDAKSVGEASNASSLEEGEVSDDGDRRPEESEPRPVCRFYSRGQCTWGISCRFLHPGVTDKGNYSMFEVMRGVQTHAPPAPFVPRVEPPPPESAWERGLRTAKEMLRLANKRKEQDIDFEEKKLHLSVGGAVHDPDAELAYAAAAVGASPPRAVLHDYPDTHPHAHAPHRQIPPHVYARGGYPPPYRRYPPGRHVEEREPYERPAYERLHYEDPKLRYEDQKPRFEELPSMEDGAQHKRRVRSSREVIVQRAPGAREGREVREQRDGREPREQREGREPRESREPREGREQREVREVRENRDGRDTREVAREVRDGAFLARGPPGDDWADPWMRESAAARRRRPPSSHSSYSTSSSRSSRSPGSRRDRKHASLPKQRLSPSVIVRERRLATARATAMNPPAPRRRAPSPAAARQHSANPPAPLSALPARKDGIEAFGRGKPPSRTGRKRYSRTSSSGSESSSSSSGSDSESRSSSSSGSSSDARRARTVRALNAANRPRLPGKPAGLGAGTMAAAANKKDVLVEQKESSAKKRAATSPAIETAPAKKSVSRREELLKQLKAVEDAIARKRSKI